MAAPWPRLPGRVRIVVSLAPDASGSKFRKIPQPGRTSPTQLTRQTKRRSRRIATVAGQQRRRAMRLAEFGATNEENRMAHPPLIDAIGFVAAALVLATFCMRSMRTLRWVALASNLAFIAYGYLGNLAPVLLLHALLLPVNTWRLMELRRRPAGAVRPALVRLAARGDRRP
jgi:hypothetical protein